MTSSPDSAWRTGTVSIRPWAAPLSQHGLPKIVVVPRVGSAAAEVARTAGRRSRAGREQGQARTRLQANGDGPDAASVERLERAHATLHLGNADAEMPDRRRLVKQAALDPIEVAR